MTCDEVRETLSGYHDGELDEPLAGRVRAHLDGCGDCAGELGELSRFSRLLSAAPPVAPPPGLWEAIAAGVRATSTRPDGAGSDTDPAAPGRARRWPHRWRWVAAAASVGLATFLSSYWFASATWFASTEPGPLQTAYGLALGVYVQELEEGKRAFDRFLALHQGREVSPDGLVRQVGFTPLVPEQLPDGFRLEKSYVLATTCCKVVELHYVKGSQLVTVFQQGHGYPVPNGIDSQATEIDGVSCRRSRLGDIVILNFDGGGRNTTLLARADVAEIPMMVRLFNTTP